MQADTVVCIAEPRNGADAGNVALKRPFPATRPI